MMLYAPSMVPKYAPAPPKADILQAHEGDSREQNRAVISFHRPVLGSGSLDHS